MSAPLEDTVTVNGFTVIQIKFEETSQACHCLYLKEHNELLSCNDRPKDRTLFVINLPPYTNEQCLERLFSECGKIKKVEIQDKPGLQTQGRLPDTFSHFKPSPGSGVKVAYIVFNKSASLRATMKMNYKKERVMSTPEAPILTGIQKWCNVYENKAPIIKELQQEIDDFMEDYDGKIEEEKRIAKEQEGVPDEDGWITVSKHGKNKGASRSEAQEQKVTVRERKKRKEKELLNFYAFQIRESKRESLAKLRERFEEDKQKIQLMKATRKFKPY